MFYLVLVPDIFSPLVTIPVAPMITGITKHFCCYYYYYYYYYYYCCCCYCCCCCFAAVVVKEAKEISVIDQLLHCATMSH
jgi:hypothetical protein